MINQPLPAFSNVVANGVATLRVPSYDLTLNRIVLTLGGTALTKAMMTDIKLKIGSRTVYNASGADVDGINKYKGIFDAAGFLTLDFIERDQPDITVRELGGYSLPFLRKLGDMTIEITIAGATAPTLSAVGFYNAPQQNPLLMKLIKFQSPSGVAGRFPINLQLGGALCKRLHLIYAAGADWTATTDGNINRVEVKKNGLVIHDMTCREVRFNQQEFRKVPQSRRYVVDFINDNNYASHLNTKDAVSLEVNTYLTIADAPVVLAEVLDLPNNL